MKTHYEVRGTPFYKFVRIELEDKHRWSIHPDATLWRVERESDEEAAVRRMKHLSHVEKTQGTTVIFLSDSGKTLADRIDEKCPPPAKETQLDWNTGEPIETVHCWQLPSGLFMASIHSVEECRMNGDNSNFVLFMNGLAATGGTEQAARINLAQVRIASKISKLI
jgi:hypothetical protein